MHLYVKLSSLLLIKVYLDKISLTFCVCRAMGSICHFSLLAKGLGVGWRSRGVLATALFRPSVLHVGKLSCSSSDMDPCFCLHITFFLSPQHKPRPGPLRRRVQIPLTCSLSFPGPQAVSSEPLQPTVLQPHSFYLFPATRSVSTLSFSLSRQNFAPLSCNSSLSWSTTPVSFLGTSIPALCRNWVMASWS